MIIQNGCNTPLNALQGTVPDVSGALLDRYQQMTFTNVAKIINQVFLVNEIPTDFSFMGNWTPAQPTQLEIKTQGEREWNWFSVLTASVLPLQPDDVVTYLGTQYRVMNKFDFTINGFIEYRLINDYSGVGP